MPVSEIYPTTEQVEIAIFVIGQLPGGQVKPELRERAEATLMAALKSDTDS